MIFSLSFSVIFVCTCLSKLIHLYAYMGTVSAVALVVFLPSLLVPHMVVICLSRLILSSKRTTIAYMSRLLGFTFSYVVEVYDGLSLTADKHTGSFFLVQQLFI
jgi:hypothetical protein